MRLQLILFQSILVLGCKSFAQSSEQLKTENEIKSYILTLGERYVDGFEKLDADKRVEVLGLDSIWITKYELLVEDSDKEGFKMLPWRRKKLEKEMSTIEMKIRVYLEIAAYSDPPDEK